MFIIQMTGLSGAGKSTLASTLKTQLEAKGIPTEVIDADEYRKSLCKDLEFSAEDRMENIRRLASVADHYRQSGVLPIIAAINPYEEVRSEIRERLGAKTIWIRCDLNLLIQRDPKGLYKKAMLPDDDPEKIRNLTGVNDPYEPPESADLVIDTGNADVETSTKQLLFYVLTLLNPEPR
jgi:adenylylsulfate kinase